MIQLAETTKHETTRQMETSRNEMADSIGPDGEYLFPELRQVTAAGDVVIDPDYLKPIEPSLAGEPGLNSQPDASQPTPVGDASGVPAEPPVEAAPVPEPPVEAVPADPAPEPPVEAAPADPVVEEVPADPAPVEADPGVEAEPVPADPAPVEADPVVEAEPASDDPLAGEPTT